MGSPINLTGPLGAPVEEVVAVPERETVSQVMTTATKEKVGSEHVGTLGKAIRTKD